VTSRSQIACKAWIAVIGTGEFAPDPVEPRRQHPILERRPVAQSAGLARQNRNVMPGIVDRLAAAVSTQMLGHHASVVTDDDPIGIGVNVDRTAGRWRSPSTFLN
jgi:hypothetical protein